MKGPDREVPHGSLGSCSWPTAPHRVCLILTLQRSPRAFSRSLTNPEANSPRIALALLDFSRYPEIPRRHRDTRCTSPRAPTQRSFTPLPPSKAFPPASHLPLPLHTRRHPSRASLACYNSKPSSVCRRARHSHHHGTKRLACVAQQGRCGGNVSASCTSFKLLYR